MIVVFDTDRIKEYVFATNKLKEIEGASAILNYLNQVRMEEEVRRVCGNNNFTKIYADGGGAAFEVPDGEEEKVITAVKELYARETNGGASITGVKYQMVGSNYNFREISEAIRREKETKLAERRINEGSVSQVSLPHMRFCDSCGINYATEVIKNPDSKEEEEWLCPVCLKKRNFLASSVGVKSLDETIRQSMVTCKDTPIAQSFDDIASKGSLSKDGYLAIIYADGNGIGKKMEEIKSIHELKSFSEKMNKAMYNAVANAIEDTLNNAKKFEKLPFKVLLLAGDDLVLSINADLAFPVAVKIAENFEKATNLSLSIGMVISHKNFPFKQALNYATSLLSYTKKKRAEINVLQQKSVDSMISFITLASAIPLSPNKYFNDYLSVKKNGKVFRLTAQPYTINQMQKLIHYIQLLKKNNFPKTKLSEIREAIYKGGFSTVIDITSIITRLGNGNRNNFESLIKGDGLNFGTPTSYIYPWFLNSSKIVFTHLLDAIEMYKFMQEG